MYYNIVVHNQAERKRDDWTDRNQTFHRTTILHTCPTKQAGVVAADAVLTQILALMPPPNFLKEFLRILIHT